MSAKRIRKSKRNRGGYLLARLSIDYAELALACGVSKPCITQWVKGTTKPATPKRELLFRLHNVPTTAWDEPVSGAKPDDPKAESASGGEMASPAPEGVRAQADSMSALVTSEMTRIQADGEATPEERMVVIGKASAILERLAKITGEGEITTKKILGSVFWRQIVECMLDASRHCPTCPAAIAAALRKLDE